MGVNSIVFGNPTCGGFEDWSQLENRSCLSQVPPKWHNGDSLTPAYCAGWAFSYPPNNQNCLEIYQSYERHDFFHLTLMRNKLAKLRRHASRVHFAKIHFGTSIIPGASPPKHHPRCIIPGATRDWKFESVTYLLTYLRV